MFRSAFWKDSENKVSKGSVWDGNLGDQGGGQPGPADRTFTAMPLHCEENRRPHRTREYAAVPPRSPPKAKREADWEDRVRKPTSGSNEGKKDCGEPRQRRAQKTGISTLLEPWFLPEKF